MIYKLHTSKETQAIFDTVGSANGLQPFALAKIAIALSIHQGTLSAIDFETDNDGLELNRQTIFGEYDMLFRCLIVNQEKHMLEENEYFPKTVKAHLDRGAKILLGESRYGKNLFMTLCQIDKNI